jgi:hypothetical protein
MRLRNAAIAVALMLVWLSLAGTTAQATSDCGAQTCIYLPMIEQLVAPTAQPAPDEQPSTLRIKSSRGLFKGTSYYVAGEVFNGTASPKYFVQVVGKFYDADDQLVAVDDTFAFLTKTAPGQSNPFRLIIGDAAATIERYELMIGSALGDGLNYQPVTVRLQQVRDRGGVEVFGEVRNDHVGELHGIEVAVTFYDQAGNVVDADFDFPAQTTLAPGATSPYKVSTFETALSYARVVVQGQGYLAP